ncbi:MAG: hypothetical protein P4L55_24110 [Syntrophobacteraceae bacterium]|nr:hypothetical protein [Syntrophobacteraceae bacterium]
MKTALRITVVWLLVLFPTSFATALAAGSPLGGTTWTGNRIALVTTAGTITDQNTLSIFFMENPAKPGLLYGTLTFTPSGFTQVPFTAIRHGNSLSIVAHTTDIGYTGASYLIEADMAPSGKRKGANSTAATMRIRGQSLSDASQFEGALTE